MKMKMVTNTGAGEARVAKIFQNRFWGVVAHVGGNAIIRKVNRYYIMT